MSFSDFVLVFAVLPIIVYFGALALIMGARYAGSKKLSAAAQAFSRMGEYPVNILVVGDSLAVGVGSYGGGTIAERLALLLNASVENAARSGAMMAEVQRQIATSAKEKYDYVLILAGANDIIQRTPDGLLQDAIRATYILARTRSERVIALTSGDIGAAPFFMFPFTRYFSDRTIRTRPFFTSIAQELGVAYVNLLAYADSEFQTEPKKYYAPDMLHLSAEGYGVWFEHIREHMQKTWGVADVVQS